ncbi:hypothetical protein [Bacillus infantis]|uniref:hypothetical protein n=1 Tax=Bacillus infantis TaxID=324767 RepID=UPI00209ED970|nr:hypothetical protein [Bacillus infantis]MCP1161362.1 hypothetical protein [Bacillus infantis]
MNKIINSYYLYYNNTLKNKQLSEGQLISEMLKRFGNATSIKISEWGRTTRLKSININKDNVEYIIPLHTPKEILGLNKTMGEKLLEDYNWVIPPYIQMRIIFEMISKNKVEDIEVLYKSTYTPMYFASQITSMYKNISIFNDYLSLIVEAIECFLLKKIASSITLLFTIIEGIARNFCEKISLPYNKKGSTSAFDTAIKYRKNQWRDTVLLYNFEDDIKQIIPNDYLKDALLIKVDEAMDMFVSFEKYGLDYLYKSESDFTLNRHSILHGFNREYYIPINFFRLFSCLEMLAVVVSNKLMPNNIEEYEETIRLYNRLQLLENLNFIEKI